MMCPVLNKIRWIGTGWKCCSNLNYDHEHKFVTRLHIPFKMVQEHVNILQIVGQLETITRMWLRLTGD